MLVKRFKFKRNSDKGGFQWTAESEMESPGFYRGFHAVGKTLADVKEFASLVRWCERTGSLELLSEMHPCGNDDRMQTTWGGTWYRIRIAATLRWPGRSRVQRAAPDGF
jgi:hypothetical protein